MPAEPARSRTPSADSTVCDGSRILDMIGRARRIAETCTGRGCAVDVESPLGDLENALLTQDRDRIYASAAAVNSSVGMCCESCPLLPHVSQMADSLLDSANRPNVVRTTRIIDSRCFISD